jgi:hypothetical protein
MTRDYKHSVAKKQPATSHWWRRPLDVLVGLTIGLFVALLVHLDLVHLPEPAPQGDDDEQEELLADPALPDSVVGQDFDFYVILPESEIKVPDWSLATPEVASDAARGKFLLQVGSFRHYRDADRRKASLALQGITANIQRAVINGQEVWFRVMVGPLEGKSELQKMRQKLIEIGIDMMIIRQKNASPP